MRNLALIFAILLAFFAPSLANGQTVHFTADAKRDVHPISRFIYGINQPLGGPWQNLTLTRLGGNRWTAYNWVNNASNAGSDWHFQNDNYLGGGDEPGGAMLPGIKNAFDNNAAIILTIPINGYVSADKSPPDDVRSSGADYLQKRFRMELPEKDGTFKLQPDPNQKVVYEDEFVNWVKMHCPYGQTDPNRPVFFMLDNEPSLWSNTHAEVHPAKLTYFELVEKSIAYARAVKKIEPDALVFGPASFGWSEFISLQNAPDAKEKGDFLDYYLTKMLHASCNLSGKLLDVLDVHWYPEPRPDGVRIIEDVSTPDVAAVRVQNPRSLWDPTYIESSWITKDSLHGPIELIPRLMRKIAKQYPGTRLSISEYNFGGGNDISGGIAEADVLGILGREGVFAAAEWPLKEQEKFIAGAFAIYRNFDGKGASFGDKSIKATTDDVENTSIYASTDSSNPKVLTLVLINKSLSPVKAKVDLQNVRSFKTADIYDLTARSATLEHLKGMTIEDPNQLETTLPARSVMVVRMD